MPKGSTRRFASLFATCALLCATIALARAQEDTLRIGVLGDMSGYAQEIGGPGSVLAVKMAVEEHGGKAAGMAVDVVSADFLNKPDLAAQIARRWFDVDHVDVITDLPNTPAALAVARLGRDTNHVVLVTEAATPELTNGQCSATTVHMADDTNAVAAGTARALVEEGLRSWFFLTADFGFGLAMQASAEDVLRRSGATVAGSVRHPLSTSDFSSYLLQAQASKAQVVALANLGADTTNAIRQANEFGVQAGGQKIAGLLMVLSDIKALGLEAAQDLYVTEGFYWDRNEATRAFARRFAARNGGVMPTKAHAANYVAVGRYLEAVEAAGSKSPAAVMAKLRAAPFDFFGRPASLRADGRVVYDIDVFQVKAPAESSGPYDFYKLVRTIPGDQAFAPMNPAACPLAR